VNGKIVVVGYSSNSDGGVTNALVRYNNDGSLDTSFGVAGKLMTDFGTPGAFANSVVLQSDGKIVVVGLTTDNVGKGDFALARYIGNASPTIGNLESNLRLAITGQPFTLSYATLLAALHGSDIDGDTIQIRVEQVVNGLLTKNGVSVTPGVTSIGPNESLAWTPPANGNTALAAFVLRAFDPLGATSANAVTINIDVTTITRYLRAYNPQTDHHFFTMSPGEFTNAVTVLGYRDETAGNAGFAVVNGFALYGYFSAVHRLYNPNNNRHYYTANSLERDVLVSLGYRYEKDEGGVFNQQLPGMVTIFRLYNYNSGSHLLVESAAQRDSILAQFPGIWVRHADFGFAFVVSAGSAQARGAAVSRAIQLAPSLSSADVTGSQFNLTATHSEVQPGLIRPEDAVFSRRNVTLGQPGSSTALPMSFQPRQLSAPESRETGDTSQLVDHFWEQMGSGLPNDLANLFDSR
jgi:uncharacterized delta-60 repeat protein